MSRKENLAEYRDRSIRRLNKEEEEMCDKDHEKWVPVQISLPEHLFRYLEDVVGKEWYQHLEKLIEDDMSGAKNIRVLEGFYKTVEAHIAELARILTRYRMSLEYIEEVRMDKLASVEIRDTIQQCVESATVRRIYELFKEHLEGVSSPLTLKDMEEHFEAIERHAKVVGSGTDRGVLEDGERYYKENVYKQEKEEDTNEGES